MGDTGSLEEDVDLLSLLESVSDDENSIEDKGMEDKSDVEKALEDEESEKDKKIEELKEIASSLTKSVSGGVRGSGDLDVDLDNWFNGKDQLPSEPLSEYVSNPTIKMDYGLARTTLSSYNLMSKLKKFIEEDAFDQVFSDSAILGLEPDEVLDRVKVAFSIYKDLASLNQKTIMSLKELKLKSNVDSDSVDKLTLLLSSIPSNKLEDVLKDISKGKI